MGCEQLRKNLQLAIFLQRLSRRTSFPTKSPLDENGEISPEHRASAETGRRAYNQARAHVDARGETPGGYVLNLKLYKEKELLLETEAKLSKRSPLVIKGPQVGGGQLLLVLVVQ